MMNFSDETVEKVENAINRARVIRPMRYDLAKAALSSLTLADLMQVDEVRELVRSADAALLNMLQGYAQRDLAAKLKPFTEAKQ